MTNQENGGGNAPATIEIIWLRRISQSQPTAWEGSAQSGEKVHIAYRYGELSISLWRRSRGHPGNWGSWEDAVRLRPIEMMAEIRLGEDLARMNGSRRVPVAMLRQQLRLESDSRVLGEIRSDVWPRKGARARIVTAHELWTWLEMREKHFEMLTHRGMAGGSLRVKLTALGGD